MKIVTPYEMKEIDRRCIEALGIPGVVLMENAAVRLVDEIGKDLGQTAGKKIVLFAGKGNNGGDAFAATRHLFNKGALVSVVLLAESADIKGDALLNLKILQNMGLCLISAARADSLEKIREVLAAADLVVDGIFGTGFKGEMEGSVQELVECINRSQKRVIAIDIPSGLDGETGRAGASCMRAHKTVTFGFPKTGLMIHPGCEYTGELIIADIGIPSRIAEEMDIRMHWIEETYVVKLLPGRPADSNKGDYGRVLIVSGSVGMTGAGCLSAEAALRTGAGLVYLAVPAVIASIYDAVLTESITLPMEDKGSGYLDKGCLDAVQKHLERCDAAAVGPGLSAGGDIPGIVAEIIERSRVPLVLDADALNAIASDIRVLGKKSCDLVITPHPGEMARLMGISIDDVQNNRVRTAREFAAQWKVIVVLKGARTVIALPDGTVYLNTTGNPGMATAGTGDVLTGMIAGLAGQGVPLAEASIAGVYLHGCAGDEAAADKGMHGVIAGDLVRRLPYTIKQCRMKSRE